MTKSSPRLFIVALTVSMIILSIAPFISSVQAQSITPFAMSNDYDGSWHNSDFTITLSTDDSGATDIWYTINGGSTQMVSSNGQPLITVESSNNVISYWSVDGSGTTLSSDTISGIKLDKTAPTGSIVINNGDPDTASTTVTLALTYSDSLSGVSQVRYGNDAVDASSWESPSATKTWTLTSGTGMKNVFFQVKDNAGVTSPVYSASINLNAGGSSSSSSSSSSSTTVTPTPSGTNQNPSASPTVAPTLRPFNTETPTPDTTTKSVGLPFYMYAIIAGVIIAVLIPSAVLMMRRGKGGGKPRPRYEPQTEQPQVQPEQQPFVQQTNQNSRPDLDYLAFPPQRFVAQQEEFPPPSPENIMTIEAPPPSYEEQPVEEAPRQDDRSFQPYYLRKKYAQQQYDSGFEQEQQPDYGYNQPRQRPYSRPEYSSYYNRQSSTVTCPYCRSQIRASSYICPRCHKRLR